MSLSEKSILLQKRRWRIRSKVKGTVARPRLSLHFSNTHIYAQCIDDVAGRTLVFASTVMKDFRGQNLLPNMEGALKFGKIFAEKSKTAGIDAVVFDRGGRRYHGCIKAFADAAREGGLVF